MVNLCKTIQGPNVRNSGVSKQYWWRPLRQETSLARLRPLWDLPPWLRIHGPRLPRKQLPDQPPRKPQPNAPPCLPRSTCRTIDSTYLSPGHLVGGAAALRSLKISRTTTCGCSPLPHQCHWAMMSFCQILPQKHHQHHPSTILCPFHPCLINPSRCFNAGLSSATIHSRAAVLAASVTPVPQCGGAHKADTACHKKWHGEVGLWYTLCQNLKKIGVRKCRGWAVWN